MTVKAYLAQEFSHTHENQAFNQLYRALTKRWGSSEDLVTLVGNFSCNASELDALVMKGASITVVDFKNFGGNITFHENGPWYADGVVVKGGSHANPYRQIHTNKFALLDWLKSRFRDFAESSNLGHISGVALFQKPIEFDASQVPAKLASWFHVVDFDNVVQRLSEIASPKLSVTADLQGQIVQALNVPPYKDPDAGHSTITVPGNEPPYTPPVDWKEGQATALGYVERLLQADKPEVLLVSGMSSTGKSELLHAIKAIAQREGREMVPLAPNAGIASLLSKPPAVEFRSIYSHIYSMAENEAGEYQGIECIVHPLRKNIDDEKAVYILDEAQLLGDSYFDLGGERYGSGHTLSDFLEFSGLGSSERKLIVLADNYQIKRAGEDKSLQEATLLESKDLAVQQVPLEQVIDDGSRSQILSTAVAIVGDIKGGRFSSLDIEADGMQINNLAKGQVGQVLQDLFGPGSDNDAVVIHFSHAAVYKTTEWIRKKLKGFATAYPQPEDRVELRSFLRQPQENDPDMTSESFVPHGACGTVVSCSSQPMDIPQTLKGRDKPVLLRFREIEVRFDGTKQPAPKFLFLEDYLLAEKPELDADKQLALRVLVEARVRDQLGDDNERLQRLKKAAKGNPGLEEDYQKEKALLDKKRVALMMADRYFNAVRMRYAYACTGHHAQGRTWPRVVVDASYDGEARANEGYFRWLYTVLTRATSQTYLANFTPITPLDKAVFKRANCQVGGSVGSLFRLPYDKDQVPSGRDLERPAPEGFGPGTHKALINLWLYVSQVLESELCRVVRVKEHPYQEQYFIESDAGVLVSLALHYDKDYDVTRIRVMEGDATLGNRLVQLLHGPLRFNDPLAQRVFEAVRAPIEVGGFVIEGGVPDNYQLRLSLNDGENGRVQLKVFYNQEGKVSTVMPEKASDDGVLEKLQRVFSPDNAADGA